MKFLKAIDLKIVIWLEGLVAKPHGKHHRYALPPLRSKTGRRRAYGLSTMQRNAIWQEAVRAVQAQVGVA